MGMEKSGVIHDRAVLRQVVCPLCEEDTVTLIPETEEVWFVSSEFGDSPKTTKGDGNIHLAWIRIECLACQSKFYCGTVDQEEAGNVARDGTMPSLFS